MVWCLLLAITTACSSTSPTAPVEVQAGPRPLSQSAVVAFIVVGSAGSPNAAEQALRSRIETLIGTAAYVDDDQVSTSAVKGCRIVVVSKTVSSTTVGSKLKSASCGVLFWEDNLQTIDKMATIQNDGSGGTSWQSNSSTLYVRPDAPSELRDGLAGTIDFYTASAPITHSPSGEALPSAAVVVAEMNQGSSRKAIYAYDKGQPLADGTPAAGRRVYFGIYDDTFDDLTANGLKLFDAAARWAGGGFWYQTNPTVSISGTTDGLLLSVAATASNPDNAFQLEYRWWWGDGVTTNWSPNNSVASHTYASAGTYSVQVKVREVGVTWEGTSVPASQNFVVGGGGGGGDTLWYQTSPTVSISGTTDGLDLSAKASATNPNNAYQLEYRWSWGDGFMTAWSRADSVASHTYASAGTYQVQVKVREVGVTVKGSTFGASQNFTVEEELGGVPIAPDQSIQFYVDNNPEGTTFVIQTGVHRGQRITPKNRQTFVGEPGAILDGDGADFAFRGTADSVTIKNLVIEDYAPGAQMGAVKGGGHSVSESTEGWTVEGCEIRYNAGGAIRTGNRMRVLNNNIHHNSQIGIVGMGDGMLVEGNEIAYNNWLKEYSYGFEAGGTKFVKTNGLVVRNNWSHHNWGPGLWTDIDNINVTIEGNLVEDNADTGIFHEISYAAVIRNNTVRRNGYDRVKPDGAFTWAYGAGILVAHSPDVEVYGNILEDNTNGIMGIQQDRSEPSPYGPHRLDNLNVHDNTVTQTTGQWAAGVAKDVDDIVFDRNLRFESNTYNLRGDVDWFEWRNADRTAAEWRSYGHDDPDGVFNFNF